jgi:hypothetical protein
MKKMRWRFLIGLGVCLTPVLMNGQEKLRTIVDDPQENTSIVIVGRHIGAKGFEHKVENRYGIMAGRDWVSQLTFDVKNITEKHITYIQFQLVILKQGNTVQAPQALNFYFGNMAATTESKHARLDPNDVVRVAMSDSERASFENYLNKYEGQDVERVTLNLREVHFDDGTGWRGGAELRQDSSYPERWRSVTSQPQR